MSSRDGMRSQVAGAHRGATRVRTAQSESRQFRYDQVVEPGSIAPGLESRQYVPVNGRAPGARQQPAERPHRAGSTGYPGARRFHPENSMNASAAGTYTDFTGRRGGATRMDATALQTRGGEPGPGAQYQHSRTVPEAMPVSRQPAQPSYPIPVNPTNLERESEGPAPFPALSEDVSYPATSNLEDMVNDDPRNPLKNHRNSVLYNMYPQRGRSAARTRRPPGTGHGTRYFQNGKFNVLIIYNELRQLNWTRCKWL